MREAVVGNDPVISGFAVSERNLLGQTKACPGMDSKKRRVNVRL